MRIPPPGKTALALAFAASLALGTSEAEIIQYPLTSDPLDGEVRQSSTGVYTQNQGSPTTHLRVGFQSNFGSDGQSAGGLNAIWFFKLPRLDLAAGDKIVGVDFVTTLLDESATNHITPRFNADLYALGFVSTPTLVANETFFFAGQEQTGQPGLGQGQLIEKVDDDFFTIFTDWQDVNATSPKKPKPMFTDEVGRFSLALYIQGIYENPAFLNNGEQYLVLRLNPDRAANETYEENGTQFYGKGTTRYRVANSESAGLVSTGTVDYSDVIPTRLTLTVDQVPEPATIGMLALGAVWIGGRRRRKMGTATRLL